MSFVWSGFEPEKPATCPEGAPRELERGRSEDGFPTPELTLDPQAGFMVYRARNDGRCPT
jgi:hypothetical protein